MKLHLRHSELIGCARQNRWSPEQEHDWRYLRGNSLVLHCTDDVAVIETPAGFVDIPIVTRGGLRIVQFRGGIWKKWWEEDLIGLMAIMMVYSELRPEGCEVLHENGGKVTNAYIVAPTIDDAHQLIARLLKHWQSYARIAKNTQRGFVMCNYCPVKERCDAKDLEDGATADWRLP